MSSTIRATADVLFDTNAAIAYMRDEGALYEVLPSDLVPAITVIVLGELEYGAAKSSRIEENRRLLARTFPHFRRLAVDEETARIYGEIQATLARCGRRIPTNDSWIAASAVRHGLPLLTRDRHFDRIEGLNILNW